MEQIEGVVLDDVLVTVNELTCACGIGAEQLALMVREGLLQPRGATPEQWRFAGSEILRARRALRLQRDLELNLAGCALALELLEEIDRLRARLRCLEGALLQVREP